MQEEEEVCGGKEEGEIDSGGFYYRQGDGLIEGFMLWLFMIVLRLWQLKTWWREIKERELSTKRKKKKLGRNVGFWSTLHSIFFMLRAWNPILFIGDGRGAF